MPNQIKYIFSFVVFPLLLLSCKKFVDVEPPVTNPSSNAVYENDATAVSVLNGLYIQMQSGGLAGGNKSITALTALNSDELKNYSVDVLLSQSYANALRSTSTLSFWQDLYKYIYVTNAALEGLDKSGALSSAVKQQLEGEAKFMRAFYYFYVVNLFGEAPLLLSTDYRTNSKPFRSATSEIYDQIVNDLKDAQILLNENYVGVDGVIKTTDRIRPNKAAATALLSRVYLYTGNWASAEAEASKVIVDSRYSLVTNLNNVFKKNSTEAILQLQPVDPNFNTLDAAVFILTSAPGTSTNFALNTNLVNSYDPTDARKLNWIKSLTSGGQTYYYPFKYQVNAAQPASEYLMLIRLAEVYLIRAEARARQEKIQDAQSDLNVVRARALLTPTMASSKDELVSAIEKERQLELFTEWGHRWFDLKRLDKINDVMSTVTPQKGGTWSPNWRLYPIPQNEILLNGNLNQNNGY